MSVNKTYGLQFGGRPVDKHFDRVSKMEQTLELVCSALAWLWAALACLTFFVAMRAVKGNG